MTKIVDVTVYYLEMCEPPETSILETREDLHVTFDPFPQISTYRKLYRAIGRDYHWLARRGLSEQELKEILHDPQCDLYLLQVKGEIAGMADVDNRQPEHPELVNFGLCPAFIGQGFGTWVLNWVVQKVWQSQPKRFWLHTCTLDHPAALKTYQQAGFRLYDERQIRREL